MSMSRKHYKAIAAMINEQKQDCKSERDVEVLYKFASGLAQVLHEDNNRFEFTTFYDACGF